MLTPQELLQIVDTMQPLLDELNGWITSDIISRLMARLGRGEGFLLTGTDEWQMEVYQSAGGHYDALQKKIQDFTKKSEAEVKAIFEDAGIRAWEADNAFYVSKGLESISLAQSERMVRILTDTYQRTNGEIRNFTRTTADASQQRFIQVLDDAHFKVITGAQGYTQAVLDAVKDVSSAQTKVQYPSGHTDTIETAVLRAVRTGVAQASGNMSIQGMVEHEWDLIRVSAHLGARYGDGGENPGNHFWWQGKLYSRTGQSTKYPDFVKATGYGTGEGLCGWNCRHSFGPGDTNHNPYADFDDEENRKMYDLSQKQRAMERRIRHQKTKLLGLRQAVDSAQDAALQTALQNEYDNEAVTLGRYNAQYNAFCKDNNLKRLSDRISVAKWTRADATSAIQAEKRALKAEQERRIIIEEQTKRIYQEIADGKYPLKINVGNQNKHIRTSHAYDKMGRKSYLFGDLDTAQALVNKYCGTGNLVFSTKNEWTHKEFVETNSDIGIVIDQYNGAEETTNRFSIHYGKNGTHIVPRKRKRKK